MSSTQKEYISISIPMLTEERRKDLCKQAKAVGEDAKVGVRSARKTANDSIKGLKEEGLPEDAQKEAETKIQDLTNSHVARIDSILVEKEKDIMTV